MLRRAHVVMDTSRLIRRSRQKTKTLNEKEDDSVWGLNEYFTFAADIEERAQRLALWTHAGLSHSDEPKSRKPPFSQGFQAASRDGRSFGSASEKETELLWRMKTTQEVRDKLPHNVPSRDREMSLVENNECTL